MKKIIKCYFLNQIDIQPLFMEIFHALKINI